MRVARFTWIMFSFSQHFNKTMFSELLPETFVFSFHGVGLVLVWETQEGKCECAHALLSGWHPAIPLFTPRIRYLLKMDREVTCLISLFISFWSNIWKIYQYVKLFTPYAALNLVWQRGRRVCALKNNPVPARLEDDSKLVQLGPQLFQ